MGAKRYVVNLTEEERAHLLTLVGRGVAPARTVTHARILLKADQGEAGPVNRLARYGHDTTGVSEP